MAKITSEQMGVTVRDHEIVLEIPMDGRTRKLVLAADHAVAVSNKIGNAACDALGEADLDRFSTVREFKLLPFGKEAGAAHALLRFDLEAGPLIVRVDAAGLRALAVAADAALEFANTGGDS